MTREQAIPMFEEAIRNSFRRVVGIRIHAAAPAVAGPDKPAVVGYVDTKKNGRPFQMSACIIGAELEYGDKDLIEARAWMLRHNFEHHMQGQYEELTCS